MKARGVGTVVREIVRLTVCGIAMGASFYGLVKWLKFRHDVGIAAEESLKMHGVDEMSKEDLEGIQREITQKYYQAEGKIKRDDSFGGDFLALSACFYGATIAAVQMIRDGGFFVPDSVGARITNLVINAIFVGFAVVVAMAYAMIYEKFDGQRKEIQDRAIISVLFHKVNDRLDRRKIDT